MTPQIESQTVRGAPPAPGTDRPVKPTIASVHTRERAAMTRYDMRRPDKISRARFQPIDDILAERHLFDWSTAAA